MSWLELRSTQKAYPGGLTAIRSVDLSVNRGEMFVIVGPSGSGKSTLLRLIAGLETPDSGSVWLDGRRIDGLAPRDRDVAMVFQDQALYPHLDVFENVAFGLRARRRPKAEVSDRVEASAKVLGLADLLRRRPGTLSGGQRRRVALARAMVLRPKLFLLDEPFSGLDAPLRASTRSELSDLRDQLDATMILVTHDQAEAMAMGDRVAVLDHGRVAQTASPIELYDRPSGRFVAQFLGQPGMGLLPCLVAVIEDRMRIQLVEVDEAGPWFEPVTTHWAASLRHHGSARVDFGVRAEQVEIRPDRPSISLRGIVTRVEPMGSETLVTLKIGPHSIVARLEPSASARVGEPLSIGLDFGHGSWFDSDTGERIN